MASLYICSDSSCERHSTDQSQSVDEDVLQVLIKTILPASSTYKYIVCRAFALDGTDNQASNPRSEPKRFECWFRVNTFSKEEFLLWKTAFEDFTCTTLRCDKTKRSAGIKLLNLVHYRCQHNTRPRVAESKSKSKHTNCPAAMIVKIYNTTLKNGKHSKSKDPHRHNWPTEIRLIFNHNHPLQVADVLKHRDVSESAKRRLEEILLAGYSPVSAIKLFKFDLLMEDPDNFAFNKVDRAKCPDRDYVYRLHKKLFKQQDRPSSSSKSCREDILAIQELVDSLNNRSKSFAEAGNSATEVDTTNKGQNIANPAAMCTQPVGDCVRVAETPDGHIALAVCTPMMKRVHRYIKDSGDMVFCDANSSRDRSHCKVFVLLIHSFGGGLPLGVLIVTKESEKSLQTAFTLYNSLLDDNAFYGRGTAGPAVFMTDDCKAERTALSAIYPHASLLLSTFHVQQTFWRFVWDNKNLVAKTERQHLFALVTEMLHANTDEELQIIWQIIKADSIVLKHNHVFKYIQSLYEKKSDWAACCRLDLPIQEAYTSNYCESSRRVLKDQILNLTKAFTVKQLLDFIVVRFDLYYQRRCLDVANNKSLDLESRKFQLSSREAGEEPMPVHISENHFEVSSRSDHTKVHTVDISEGFCTCHAGASGGHCKHQQLIIRQHEIPSWNAIPACNAEMQQLLSFVATGAVVNTSRSTLLPAQPQGDESTPNTPVQTETSTPARITICMAPDPFDAKISQFDGMIADIRAKMIANKDLFAQPLDQMLLSYSKITTLSGLQSSVAGFGQNVNDALPSAARKHKLDNKTTDVEPPPKHRTVRIMLNRMKPSHAAGVNSENQQDNAQSESSRPEPSTKYSFKICFQKNASARKTRSGKTRAK